MASPFLHEPGEYISVLDLNGCCNFKSQSSISFDLGHRSDGLFDVIGWVDVHYPCDHVHCKVRLRVSLPADYEDVEKINVLVQELFSALAIPADTIYELSLVCGGRQLGFINRKDVL